MRVTRVTLRDFRVYEDADVPLGDGLTVVTGANGAGKTNLLEALYFGCTGRSFRTANEREVVRFGADVARVEVLGVDETGEHRLAVGLRPGEPKRMSVDGAKVERLSDSPARPLVGVFMPDRLELVKGTPSARRAHVDQVVVALWPARATTRRSYARALAQRNALLARVRAGAASRDSFGAWDLELARHGVALMADRAAAIEALGPRFADRAADLGLDEEPELEYRPRSRATEAADLAAELAERVDGDLERGFTGHGPHRDDLALTRGGRALRAYGSQGQQRLALLALLLAEREAIAAERPAAPLLLLDDVMSELDEQRRERLVTLLRAGGQAVITATELAHVPGADRSEVARVAVAGGRILAEHSRMTPRPPSRTEPRADAPLPSSQGERADAPLPSSEGERAAES
ncbi:MAG: replication and repair protein RecF, partial [Solirubrobacterales bacterium]|nr:replication and repair protein RecF [Solirubrobacterales bacterium]